jgi:hypothetical protein
LRRPARTELIWEGKYDASGKRVAPLRVALQTVETVNESHGNGNVRFFLIRISRERVEEPAHRRLELVFTDMGTSAAVSASYR